MRLVSALHSTFLKSHAALSVLAMTSDFGFVIFLSVTGFSVAIWQAFENELRKRSRDTSRHYSAPPVAQDTRQYSDSPGQAGSEWLRFSFSCRLHTNFSFNTYSRSRLQQIKRDTLVPVVDAFPNCRPQATTAIITVVHTVVAGKYSVVMKALSSLHWVLAMCVSVFVSCLCRCLCFSVPACVCVTRAFLRLRRCEALYIFSSNHGLTYSAFPRKLRWRQTAHSRPLSGFPYFPYQSPNQTLDADRMTACAWQRPEQKPRRRQDAWLMDQQHYRMRLKRFRVPAVAEELLYLSPPGVHSQLIFHLSVCSRIANDVRHVSDNDDIRQTWKDTAWEIDATTNIHYGFADWKRRYEDEICATSPSCHLFRKWQRYCLWTCV